MTVSKNKKNKSGLGPSVELVSPNSGLIYEKKMGGNKFHLTKTKLGDGSEGGLVKDQTFTDFSSSLQPSLTLFYCFESNQNQCLFDSFVSSVCTGKAEVVKMGSCRRRCALQVR